jgi:DNA-binding IscR family transcriptional regulator
MQALVRANILRGVRGPRGGYRLARERRRISVKEVITVIEALEGEETTEHFNSPLGQQIIAPLCSRLQRAIDAEMDGITIADLCTGINQPDQEPDNFTI